MLYHEDTIFNCILNSEWIEHGFGLQLLWQRKFSITFYFIIKCYWKKIFNNILWQSKSNFFLHSLLSYQQNTLVSLSSPRAKGSGLGGSNQTSILDLCFCPIDFRHLSPLSGRYNLTQLSFLCFLAVPIHKSSVLNVLRLQHSLLEL